MTVFAVLGQIYPPTTIGTFGHFYPVGGIWTRYGWSGNNNDCTYETEQEGRADEPGDWEYCNDRHQEDESRLIKACQSWLIVAPHDVSKFVDWKSSIQLLQGDKQRYRKTVLFPLLAYVPRGCYPVAGRRLLSFVETLPHLSYSCALPGKHRILQPVHFASSQRWNKPTGE